MEKKPGKIRIDQNLRQVILRRVPPSDLTQKIYADPQKFISDLCGFVRDGFKAGETIIVIATSQHLLALENEMRAEGFDIFYMTLRGQYITFNVETVLEKFMVNEWPDEVLFKHLVSNLATRALRNDTAVRAFSEMAAFLWMKGHRAASAHLEVIWNKILQTNKDYPDLKIKNEVLPLSEDDESPPPLSFLR